MVEEIKSLRRNKKIAGVEDPIVIVQRLLNVFRQLHILDEKQKTDFDNMILQQPPEIRHMCTALPGGSLLQEYVDELEEKHGIAPDQVVSGEHLAAGVKENILANALAEKEAITTAAGEETPAPAKAAAPQPAASTASSAESLELQKQMLLMMQAMQTQNNNNAVQAAAPAAATIKADANFAKDIASALADAMAESDEKRHQETMALTKSITQSQLEITQTLIKELGSKKESSAPAVITDSNGVKVIDNTKEITKAITESQLEMAKMFLQHNAISASNSNANNANNIQINNTPAPALNTQELVGDIIKAQSQLFREMAKEQTKELSAIISVALKESNQLSNKTLINALSAFQKENLKFFKQQAKNQTVIYQQVPATAAAGAMVAGDTVQQPVYQYAEPSYETTGTTESNEPSYIKKMLGNMFNRGHNREDNEFENQAAVKENEPEPQVEYEYVEVPAEANIQEEESAAQEARTENVPQIEEQIVETPAAPEALETDDVSAEETADNDEDRYEISGDGLGLSDITAPAKKKKKKKKKKKNNGPADGETTAPAAMSPADRELSELLNFDDTPVSGDEAALSQSGSSLDTSLFDLDMPTTPSLAEENISSHQTEKDDFPKLDMSIFSSSNATATAENSNIFNNEVSAAETPDNIQDTEWEELPEPVETSQNEDIATGYDNLSSDYSEADEPEFEKTAPANAFAKGESDDFAAAEMPIDLSGDDNSIDLSNEETSQPLENSLESDDIFSDGQDFNSEETELELAAPDTTATIHSAVPETQPQAPVVHSSLIPDLQSPDALDNLLNTFNSSLNDDQPVDLDAEYKIALDTNDEGLAETADDNSEWEWEYEEAPEDEAAEQPQVQAQSEGEDGEWEWEYEEVPEDETAEQTQVQAQSEGEDSEWEWEYEEVPEDEAAEQPQVQAQNEGEDGEWEWEYEEVPEDEAAEQPQVQAQSESEDGEWEWEYEEVPENEAAEQPQVQAQSEGEDGEWEWEYEEVPETSVQETDLADPTAISSTQFSPQAADEEISTLFSDDSDMPEEKTILPAEQEDVDFSALFDNFDKKTAMPEGVPDPYAGGSDENGNDLDMTPLQSGSLYFQEDIAPEHRDPLAPKNILPQGDDEIVFADLADDENKNEPYALNSDLKP